MNICAWCHFKSGGPCPKCGGVLGCLPHCCIPPRTVYECDDCGDQFYQEGDGPIKEVD